MHERRTVEWDKSESPRARQNAPWGFYAGFRYIFSRSSAFITA